MHFRKQKVSIYLQKQAWIELVLVIGGFVKDSGVSGLELVPPERPAYEKCIGWHSGSKGFFLFATQINCVY